MVITVENVLLSVRHLKKAFGDHVIFEDFDLDVRKGEVVVVIGPSGCGKSTLLRCLNGLEPIQGGEILLEGEPVLRESKSITRMRQKIGMVFQSYELFPHKTILENILLAPMKVQKRPRAEVEKEALELLERVGLADRKNDYPRQLSGGQKQRVAIARALATDPKVLLCDEATSALDPTTTASILALLKDLNEKLGVTVVVITHQMSVIEEICSRVAILDGGVVAEQGKVEDIFSNPHTDAARRLVYPGGVSLEQYPAGTHAVRVAFNGGTAYQPLIASLAIDLGVKVNILGADTRNIEGRAFGTMLLGLPDNPNEAAKALSYIRAQPNVSAEEVEYHV